MMAIKDKMIVNKRGMITIPSEIRKKFNLHPGSEVSFMEICNTFPMFPDMVHPSKNQ